MQISAHHQAYRRIIHRGLLLFVVTLAACASPRTGNLPLRVVSYNIKHGLGMDGQLDLERTARVLEVLAPDVVLLQEVDENCRRSGSMNQAQWLGERLGMRARFAPFMDHDGGRYGLATLTRNPIIDSQVIALPPGQHEPRAALVVTLEVGQSRLRIANAHLDWLSDDTQRKAQAAELFTALTAPWNSPNLGFVPPVLLGGDLNDLHGSPALAPLTQPNLQGYSFRWLGPKAPTFPANAPERTIDHFLIAPKSAVKTSVVSVVNEEVASDHRPVLLSLQL